MAARPIDLRQKLGRLLSVKSALTIRRKPKGLLWLGRGQASSGNWPCPWGLTAWKPHLSTQVFQISSLGTCSETEINDQGSPDISGKPPA